eukprot:3915796-Ditylum_brightwellii.AAC.2
MSTTTINDIMKKKNKIVEINKSNNDCESHLLSLITVHNKALPLKKKCKDSDVMIDCNIANATLKLFAACSGSLKDAEEIMCTSGMDDNLMTLAFKHQNIEVIFQEEKDAVDANDIDDNHCKDLHG